MKHYALDPLSPFPKRWRDHIGPIRVMAGPVKGWVMVRRPGSAPFVLRVSNLTNAERCDPHGPFEIVAGQRRAAITKAQDLEGGE